MANILIVDDEEMDRLLHARMVEDAGHTPFFAGDGEAAMVMYKENDIALVVTDLRMPKVDGLSLIRGILAHDPSARIIAVSGLPQHLEAAEEYGAVAGLVKPIEQEEFLATIEDILGSLSESPPPPRGPRASDPWGTGI